MPLLFTNEREGFAYARFNPSLHQIEIAFRPLSVVPTRDHLSDQLTAEGYVYDEQYRVWYAAVDVADWLVFATLRLSVSD